MEKLLRISNLNKSFKGSKIIKELNLEIEMVVEKQHF